MRTVRRLAAAVGLLVAGYLVFAGPAFAQSGADARVGWELHTRVTGTAGVQLGR